MYAIVGLHYPVTMGVLKQYFNTCKEGSSMKISYKKIGEEVVKKEDQLIQKQKEDFDRKREQERPKERKVTLDDDNVM